MHYNPSKFSVEKSKCRAVRFLVTCLRNAEAPVSVPISRTSPQPTSGVGLGHRTTLDICDCANHCIGDMFGLGGI